MQKIIKNIAKLAVAVAILLPFNGANAASPISCPLSAGSGDVVINLPSIVLTSNKYPDHASEVSGITVPAGTYDITAVAWDDHATHGGQNQPMEQIYFMLLDGNNTRMFLTNSTADIAENADYVTTLLNTGVSFNSDIKKIQAVNYGYKKSTAINSVYPICIKFDRKDVTLPPPPTPTDFSVSCSVSDRNVETDDDVTFTAAVTGGNSPFTYRWSGDVSGSGRSITDSFDEKGNYHASVRVTDEDGLVRSADCATVVVGGNNHNNDNLSVSCDVSDSSIEEGDEVRIKVDIEGGEGPYDISWDGDTDEVDDFDDNARSQKVQFDDSGRYEFEVTVEDDNGDEDSDTCTVRVSNDRGSLSTNNGDLAGLSSVYLSQVPYTGPEDTAKVFGFIALIAVWSSVIAYYLLQNKTRSIVKSKIQAFKEANLARKVTIK